MKKMVIAIHGINDLNQFIHHARTVDGDIVVSRGKFAVDGKSIMGVFSIDVSQGCTVEYPTDATDFENFISQFKEGQG